MRNKVLRCYTFDAYVIERIEMLPKGMRSRFVNDWMRQSPEFIAWKEKQLKPVDRRKPQEGTM